jgi:small-conductance mechanosensitive channel
LLLSIALLLSPVARASPGTSDGPSVQKTAQGALEPARENALPPEESASAPAQTGEILGRIWDYQLLRVEGRSITVGKIVVALVLLFVGYLISRWIRHLLQSRLLTRLRVRERAAAVVATVVFYVLLAIFTFAALQVAGLPLHAFTLLGGAAAIGVGFGSQNIINNFISGLILLVERPVNVGDLIQLGDLTGRVEHIGPRSTRLRTGENLEIIVPNSSFLESNVVNWTLSDRNVRVKVNVGVCYGSPTDEVKRILAQVVGEHERISKTPEPVILFTEFGDNSLNFEVHFWIEMKTVMIRRTIESELRYAIDARFREAGIVIAFPQRDVHLDAAAPLDVRVVEG